MYDRYRLLEKRKSGAGFQCLKHVLLVHHRARHPGHGRWHGLFCLSLHTTVLLVLSCLSHVSCAVACCLLLVLVHSVGARSSQQEHGAGIPGLWSWAIRLCRAVGWTLGRKIHPGLGPGLHSQREPWANEQLDVAHGTRCDGAI